MGNLEHLEVVNNKLTGNVEKLKGLTKMKELYMDYNQLTGPVKALEALTALTFVDLSQNKLKGPIPASWCDGHVDCDLADNPDVCVPNVCQQKTSCQIGKFCKQEAVVVHGRNLREEK